jgi:hypothetical protein
MRRRNWLAGLAALSLIFTFDAALAQRALPEDQ